MKTIRTIGVVGSFSALLGAFLKIMHYPGANFLFPIGTLLVIIYVVSRIFNLFSEPGNAKKRFYGITLYLSLLLCFIGGLFKTMHYPGAMGPWIPIMMACHLIFMIAFLVYIFSDDSQEKKAEINSFVIIYFMLSGLFLLKGPQPNHIMNGFSSPDQAMIGMSVSLNTHNNSLYERLLADSAGKEKAQKLKGMSDELVLYITELKREVLKTADPEAEHGYANENPKIMDLTYRYDYDTPSFILMGEDTDKGSGKALDLKNKLVAYREGLLGLFDNNSRESLDKLIGLKQEGCSVDGDNLSWEECTFSHKPVGAVVVIFDELRNEIRYAESLALSRMLYAN